MAATKEFISGWLFTWGSGGGQGGVKAIITWRVDVYLQDVRF